MNLPALREELVVQEGPRLHDGQPSWTLHDPARARFFRLDWLTFEILKRWSLGDPTVIARSVGEQTPLRPSPDDVMTVVTFAGNNQLLRFTGANTSSALADSHRRMHPQWWKWLIHNYLFFRVPLVRPERFLVWLNAQLTFLYRPLFWQISTGAAFAGLLLVWRQWDSFKSTWVSLVGLHGFFGYLVVLIAVKIVHEFGHGLAATRFGCRVPSMGVAFLVMTPVAYTDTNDAWNLKERRPRLWIGAAGMLAELTLAAWATLAWGLLPDGFWRNAAFLVGTTTWIKSLAVNTSPLMRFDGYYLLSDWLDLPNLHTRSFALARWRLREWLFGLDEAPPEYFRRSLANGLTALAMFIWIYRLVVFLGIAVFVYYFFFKALGLALFAVEIVWFIALPIISELKHWMVKRKQIVRSPRLRWILAGAGVLFLLGVIPLPQNVQVEGQLSSADEFRVVAPEAARLVALPRSHGTEVMAGEILLKLESPLLQYRIEKAAAKIQSLTGELAAAGANAALRSRVPIIENELSTARASLREAQAAAAQLTPRAPFDGRFYWEELDLHVGDDISHGEKLALLIGKTRLLVTAYIDEQDAHLVSAGSAARLYIDGTALNLRVMSVDQDATRNIVHPLLTTDGGGTIPVRMSGPEMIPERTIYRVLLEVDGDDIDLGGQQRRGTVVISGEKESRFARWSRQVISVIWRELGF